MPRHSLDKIKSLFCKRREKEKNMRESREFKYYPWAAPSRASSPKQPGAGRTVRSNREQPVPGAGGRSQEQPEAARSSQEEPGAARSSEEQPAAAKKKQPGVARSRQAGSSQEPE